jgi:hypothetical protein
MWKRDSKLGKSKDLLEVNKRLDKDCQKLNGRYPPTA